MLYQRQSLLSRAAVASLATTALAGPAVVPKHDVVRETTIELAVPPMVTEVVPVFSEILTHIDVPGKITLGLGCGLLGLGCIAKTTSIESPTVCTITAVITKTTTVPCSTSTTYTECSWDPKCGCSTTKTYWWTPPPFTQTHGGYPTCPEPSNPITVTSTATSTAVAMITATATATTTATLTLTPSTTSTCPASTASALSCDKYGYLIQYAQLIRVDLSTGETETVSSNVGNGGGTNALAYNSLDNYLYARQGTKIVRIHADGTTDNVLDLTSATESIFVGDIDETGFYWVSNGGSDWYKIDMRPLSSTFGQFLDQGTIASPVSIYDWVYFPFGGSYLYSLGKISNSIRLVRFSLETYTFSTIRTLPQLPYHTFGALYGMNNGTLYASDNTEGTIWAIPIDGSAPWVATQGPESSSNDGARCVWNLVV